MKCLLRATLCLLAALGCLAGMISGGGGARAEPGSYNYSFWRDTVVAPAAYKASALWNGESLGIGAFKEPGDLYVSADRLIYVLDSGNNRIVVLDSQFKLVRNIDSFVRDGEADKFANPQGIFVTDRNDIIVADTGHQRVVHLDTNGKLVKIVEAPKSEMLQANFAFQPVRVAVDRAQRIYVMSAGVFDGFMEFNTEGEFTSFMGANRVQIDPVDYFWKLLSTRKQRSQMIMFTPTEFTNLDIDDEGFIYATNGDRFGDTIKKLNAQGNDILRRAGYFRPGGDIRFPPSIGPSRLIDIDVGDSEMYSVLDSRRGRIFTYNGDGHFMYEFGGLGNQLGEFKTPTAIDRIGEDFLVLDKALGEITVFRTTEYGRTLNEAIRSYYRGDEDKAYQMYQQTINMNANLEFAYVGLGKALLRQGDYAEAMKYFKRSKDQQNYSKAFLLYRKEVLRERFPVIMTSAVVLAIGFLLARKLRKMNRGKKVAANEQRAV